MPGWSWEWVVILSVCPSLCLFVTRVDCDKTKWCTADISIPHERKVTLLLWHQQWLVGDAPFRLKPALNVTHPFEKRRLRQISAYNVWTVRYSENSSIVTNIKSTTGFPTSYRWSTLLLSPERVAQKAIFSLKNKTQLQSNKVCYTVSLCENFHRQLVVDTSASSNPSTQNLGSHPLKIGDRV